MKEFEKMQAEMPSFSEVFFSSLEGEALEELPELSEQELSDFKDLSVQIEVLFGSTTLSLKELSSLKSNTIIPLSQHQDELCEIFINGKKIAKGKIVTANGLYGIQILSWIEKKTMI